MATSSITTDVQTITATTASIGEKPQSLKLLVTPSSPIPPVPSPKASSTLSPPAPKTVTKSASNGWLRRASLSVDKSNSGANPCTNMNATNKSLVVPFRPQSILLHPTPVVQSPTGSSDSPDFADAQNNIIRQRNSSSTSTSTTSSTTDASMSTSTSDCTVESTASTSTSLTSTSPPTIHACPPPVPSPCVTFAPLPSIAPRTRKSNRPLGIAARASMLRQRQQQYQQYYQQQQNGYDFDDQPEFNNFNEQAYAEQQHVVEVEEQKKRDKEQGKGKEKKRKSGKRKEVKGGQNGEGGDGEATILDEQDEGFAALGKLLNEASRNLWRRFSQRRPLVSSKLSTDPLPTAASMSDVQASTPNTPTASPQKKKHSNGLRRLTSIGGGHSKKSSRKKNLIIADELADPRTLCEVREDEEESDTDYVAIEKGGSERLRSMKKKGSNDPLTTTIQIDSDDEREIGETVEVVTVPNVPRLDMSTKTPSVSEAAEAAKNSALVLAAGLEDDGDVRCELEDDSLAGHSPSLDLERAHGEIQMETTVEVRIVTED